MLNRYPAALVLLFLCAAGTAHGQSQPPEGNLPTLCDITRYATSKPAEDEPPQDDSCPRDIPGQPPAPTPRPDPFMPEPPPIREQN